MGHCKDCKWWTPSGSTNPIESRLHICREPKIRSGYSYESVEEMPIDSVWLEDDEGWMWWVGPEFGCVNFEAKAG